jgi:putative ABC transport system permease protein
MAFRNIFRNKRRSFLTAMMMIVSFILMSLSLGLVEGSYGDIISLFTGQNTGHSQIVHRDYIENPSLHNTVVNYQTLMKEASSKNSVRSIVPRIYGGGLSFFNKKSLGVQIVGIDPNVEKQGTSIHKRLTQGEYFQSQNQNVAIIGKAVSNILDISVGEDIILISQGADGSVANDLFKVKGVIGSTSNGTDSYRVYLPIDVAQEFFSLYDQVHELSIHLHNINQARSFSQSYKLKDDLVIRPWQEVEADFFKAMETDKKGNNITLFIIMLIVGISILNTVLMSTLERTKEFGVLKAIGTRPINLFILIILEIVILALICSLLGGMISWGVNFYLAEHGIQLSEPIMFEGMRFSEYKSAVTSSIFFYPTIVVFFTSILAGLYPAFKASSIKVVTAMRDF